MKNTVAGLVLAGLAETCAISLHPISDPPPTKTAELNAEEHVITVSKGVALAIQCVDTNTAEACKGLRVESDDDTIVEVLPAFLAPTGRSATTATAGQPRAAFVVLGNTVGEVTVRVFTDNGHDQYTARVVTP